MEPIEIKTENIYAFNKVFYFLRRFDGHLNYVYNCELNQRKREIVDKMVPDVSRVNGRINRMVVKVGADFSDWNMNYMDVVPWQQLFKYCLKNERCLSFYITQNSFRYIAENLTAEYVCQDESYPAQLQDLQEKHGALILCKLKVSKQNKAGKLELTEESKGRIQMLPQSAIVQYIIEESDCTHSSKAILVVLKFLKENHKDIQQSNIFLSGDINSVLLNVARQKAEKLETTIETKLEGTDGNILQEDVKEFVSEAKWIIKSVKEGVRIVGKEYFISNEARNFQHELEIHEIYESFVTDYPTAKIMPGYNMKDHCFVFVDDRGDLHDISEYRGVRIISKHKYNKDTQPTTKQIQDIENKLIESGRTGFDKDREIRVLKNTIEMKYMRRHSNLIAISTSPVLSTKGEIREEHCIVFYCKHKGIRPLFEDNFPSTLERFTVDVRDADLIYGGCTDYNDPLSLGCSVGLAGRNIAGSLGPIVQESADPGKHGFLSCAHVFYDIDTLQSNAVFANEAVKIVVQPSDYDSTSLGRECGEIVSGYCGPSESMIHGETMSVGVDAVYVRTNKRNSNQLVFPNIPVEYWERNGGQHRWAELSLGDVLDGPGDEHVYKIGRTTLLTKGSIRTSGESFKLTEFNSDAFFIFQNQYTVCTSDPDYNFFEKGDSGALVFSIQGGKLRPIGLAEAMLQHGKGGFLTYVTPITAVLQAIKPQLELRVFREGMEFE